MNHWAICCYAKLVQEVTATGEYLIEAISGDDIMKVNDNAATIIQKINGKMVKGAIDTGAEVVVMSKRIRDLLGDNKLL